MEVVRGRRADQLASAKEHRAQRREDYWQSEDAENAGEPVLNLNDWRQAWLGLGSGLGLGLGLGLGFGFGFG